MGLAMVRNGSRGFTLIELIISLTVLGIMIVIVMPAINMAFTFREQTKRDENTINNQRIANGLMAYARNSNNGRLPAPYSGGAFNSTVYNAADISSAGQALSLELRNTNVPVNAINTDGSAAENVRVYQSVSGLTYELPFFITTGTTVQLTYDVGALTQTMCPVSGNCNTGIPGDSGAFTVSNVTSWTPGGRDYGAVSFSTLPEQKQMLRQTAGRINRLSDRLTSEFYTRLRLAAANSTDNYFPKPTNGGAPNLAGYNPTVNMGCHDGWYRLSASNVNILEQIGLDPAEYGVTAWGGPIEYCADYEPAAAGTGNANLPPHYAALRIRRSLSLGQAPAGIPAQDVVITF